MGAQQHRARLLCRRTWFEEHRVELTASGVRLRHVECLEVVEIELYFGTFRHFESETNEHVLQSHHRLGDDVSMPTTMVGNEFAEVNTLAGNSIRVFLVLEQGFTIRDRGGQARLGFTDETAHLLALLEIADLTQLRLEHGQLALLALNCSDHRLESAGIGSGGHLSQRACQRVRNVLPQIARHDFTKR